MKHDDRLPNARENCPQCSYKAVQSLRFAAAYRNCALPKASIQHILDWLLIFFIESLDHSSSIPTLRMKRSV
jgi:hypothetical protein